MTKPDEFREKSRGSSRGTSNRAPAREVREPGPDPVGDASDVRYDGSRGANGLSWPRVRSMFTLADAFVLLFLAAMLFAVVDFAKLWKADFQPSVVVDLSVESLPRYAALSAWRGIVAYIFSLLFSLGYGYAAARVPRAERLLIPLLDILQSIPVLGFLPGLVLALIALFPQSNMGLELAAVLMIFTGQAWNLTYSFYSSLKSIPPEYREMSRVTGLSRWQTFTRLELPFSAVGLVWNSLLSMAGGWFFLSVCESFRLGDVQFRLQGLGSYMAVAIEQGQTRPMVYGVLAMVGVILTMDFLVWRPVLVWVRRYRPESTEAVEGVETHHSMILEMLQESRLLKFLQTSWQAWKWQWRSQVLEKVARGEGVKKEKERTHLPRVLPAHRRPWLLYGRWILLGVAGALFFAACVLLAFKLGVLLRSLSYKFWVLLIRDTFWTLLRVFGALVLATLWTLPVGVMVGLSPRWIRWAQPLVQMLAAFPAPMLYPLVLHLLFSCGVSLEWAAGILLVLGCQWYILFNVLAGALGISQELQSTVNLIGVGRWSRWKKLYLPGVFPSLVVGWITAAGGAWNATIVTEYLVYKGQVLKANGLGATISRAAADGNFAALAASLVVMIGVVVAVNRTLWYRLASFVERRFT